MNIVVIRDGEGVDIYKKWKEVERDYPTLNKDSDFVKEGDDYVSIIDKESYRIVKDIKLLESIATEKVFGKKEIDWLSVGATAVTVFVLMVIMG